MTSTPDRQNPISNQQPDEPTPAQHEPSEERAMAYQDRRKIAKLFRQLQEAYAFREVDDPLAWQREIRNDRPLPGRGTSKVD